MRILWLSALLTFTSCSAAVPAAPRLKISVHAKANVRVAADAQARVRIRRWRPPPPPAPAVPLREAKVVEFFGIPLDGVRDVVFVLDRSGSMAAAAKGRIAVLGSDSAASPPASTTPQEPASQGAPPDASADPTVETPAPETSSGAAATAVPPPRASKIEVARRELIDAIERLPAGTRVNVVYFNHNLEAFAVALTPLDDGRRSQIADYVTKISATGATALAPAMRVAFLMNARRIILLSDGRGNVGGGSYAVLRDAREAVRGGVRIDTIGLGYGQDGNLLRALARESGGLYQGL